MKTAFLGFPLTVLALAGPALAQQENARVISTVPAIQQVAVPQQYCTTQPVVTSAPRTGAGAVMGAIAGGAMGNAIGDGGGRAAATVLGLVGGAMLGDRIEGPNNQVQNVQTCSTQTTYENRTVGYDVTYEYAGRQYTTRMASDPGPYVPIQVSPVSSQAAMPPPPVQSSAPVYSQPGVVVSSAPAPVVYAPAYVAPAYVAPVYAPAYPRAYPRAYYPPVGISLNLGYTHGWRHGPRW